MNSEGSQPSETRRRVRPISLRTYVFTMVFASLASLAMFLSRPLTLQVDGRHMLSDVQPVTTIRTTFLPLRAVALGTGAVTSYEAKTGRIEIWRGRDQVKLRVGDHRGTLNGVAFHLTQAPFIVRGRVMVPAGLFAKALGSSVHYDSSHQSIEITTGKQRSSNEHEEP